MRYAVEGFVHGKRIALLRLPHIYNFVTSQSVFGVYNPVTVHVLLYGVLERQTNDNCDNTVARTL